MNIRIAEVRDIPALLALLVQVAEVHRALRPDLFSAGTQKYSETQLAAMLNDPQKPIFVAETDGKVVGHLFCALRDYGTEGVFLPYRSLYIEDFCIDEAYRGTGVGTQLYQYARDFAKRSGCYNLTLNVWTANRGAVDFYAACGMSAQRLVMEQIL